MNCKRCGLKLEPNATFCPNCGLPVANQVGVTNQTPIQPVVENMNNQIPQQPVVGNVNAQIPSQQPVEMVSNQENLQRVAAPIMPDAPEAPLPGTQAIPVVQQTPEDSNNENSMTQVNPEVPSVNPINQNVVNNQDVLPQNQVPNVVVQPQVQGAPTVDPTQKTKKKVHPVIIILLVILVITAIASLFILLDGKNMLNGNKKGTTSTSSSTTTSTTAPKVKEEITLNGVKIFVPFGYTVDPMSTQELGIINNTSNHTQININTLPTQNFSDYDTNFESLSTSFAEQGVTVVSSEKKMVGERLFLSFIVNANGKEEYLCYTNIRNGSVIRFELVQAGISIDDALNLFTEIAEFAVPEVTIPTE